jgi:hypothetical protein
MRLYSRDIKVLVLFEEQHSRYINSGRGDCSLHVVEINQVGSSWSSSKKL